MTWDAYQHIWTATVPEGFIAVFPTTEGSFSPSHLDFGKDIAFVIGQMTALGLNAASPFFNHVDTMNCVMGHSMGGGAAFLAAQSGQGIKALVTLAPAETTPSAIQAATGISVPALIFAGLNDCITPPPANQIPMYNNLSSNCKSYIGIHGGSHCQMADNNILCSFGEGTCTPHAAITRDAQHAVIKQYLLPWLQFELKGDCAAGARFDSLAVQDTSIAFQTTCTLCHTSGTDNHPAIFEADFYPNPVQDKIYIRCSTSGNAIIEAELISADGRTIMAQSFVAHGNEALIQWNLKNNLANGIYLLGLTVNGVRISKKIVKM
jgi:hypothetical protein